ncbi:MAG TPA: hypothetical protein VFZ25_10275 [Chloroflexota bacterium]|nr:hypothetical protein [Chloroflexota bacterium]
MATQILTNGATGTLPILNAGHPIVFRGDLVGVVSDGEIFAVGWIEPRDRPVVRAMGLAILDAPHFTPDQQFAFAAYYLLPEELWDDLRVMPDELIARRTDLPLDLIRCRRGLPSLAFRDALPVPEVICA